MIEWLYTGQVKLAISQLDDALRLCKQCRLDEFEEEIQTAFTKADSFGKLLFYSFIHLWPGNDFFQKIYLPFWKMFVQ